MTEDSEVFTNDMMSRSLVTLLSCKIHCYKDRCTGTWKTLVQGIMRGKKFILSSLFSEYVSMMSIN